MACTMYLEMRGALYLQKKNDELMNEATLDTLNIKWEHEKLARFGTIHSGK